MHQLVFSRLRLFGLLMMLGSLASASDIMVEETSLTPLEIKMVDWISSRQAEMLAELKTHVDINTGTANIEGLNRYRNILRQDLNDLGFETSEHASDPIKVLTCQGGSQTIANHLLGKRNGNSPQRILLNGHMDTVFSKDDEFQTLIIEKSGRLKGPGVADMKGGLVVMLNALRALAHAGLLDQANLTVLINSDEEIGSLGSRPLIEALAVQHDIGLVFEGSYDNLVTRARKGLGQARLRITGRESHAGGAHDDGVSANLELAHKIIEIEKLTDYKNKTTVNVGVIKGGEKRNTVPGCADAYIDLRYPTREAGDQLKKNILSIAKSATTSSVKYPGLPTIESWAVLHRPVKPQNEEVDALIAQAMAISKVIGEPIEGTRYSGGGTDGSITQSKGLPTMDSLGMDGGGAHSSREQSSVQSLMARTKLAAIMIARLIKAP